MGFSGTWHVIRAFLGLDGFLSCSARHFRGNLSSACIFDINTTLSRLRFSQLCSLSCKPGTSFILDSYHPILNYSPRYTRHEVQKRYVLRPCKSNRLTGGFFFSQALFLVIAMASSGLSPIFAYLLSLLHGKAGLAGWRWIFVRLTINFIGYLVNMSFLVSSLKVSSASSSVLWRGFIFPTSRIRTDSWLQNKRR